jgi:allantoin racemase
VRLLVVNPNSTASMTARIGAAARAVAAAGTTIDAVNPPDGPPSIEGYYDEAFAVPGLLACIARAEAEMPPPDGYAIACFDDTGLDAARALARAPVVGIGEAAFHLASLIAGRFSVVTTLARSIPAIEQNLIGYGLATRCARVRAAEVPVLSLEDPGSPARARIDAEIAAALREDRCEAIVLGCAGMTGLAATLTREHGVPVIDGVAAAVKLLEALAALGLTTSKVGGYAFPLPKPYSGNLASFAPRVPAPK